VRFIQSVQLNQTERKLKLENQSINLASCKVVAKILKACKNFSVLELKGNLIGHGGLIFLMPSILKNKNIVSVDLSSNDITGDQM